MIYIQITVILVSLLSSYILVYYLGKAVGIEEMLDLYYRNTVNDKS